MKLLAIDTSTSRATLALAVNGQTYVDEQDNLKAHAQLLLPMIDRLLKKAQIKLQQLDGIVFGCGPGSFTGIRVTCSLAKGLAYAHDLMMYPVSSLAAIAKEVYDTEPNLLPNTHVLSVIDARMQQLYWQCFQAPCVSLMAEEVMNAADISMATKAPLILAGVGFEAYQTQCSQQLLASIIKTRIVYPHAKTMIDLVKSCSIPPINPAQAQPLYVRNTVVHTKTGAISHG